MKILFLSQRVPYPPDRGDRITTWHFLRHFLKCGATVRIGTLSDDPRDDDAIALLRGMVSEIHAPRHSRRWNRLLCLRGLATGEALTLPFFANRSLARTVRRWLVEDPPDLVYVYSSSMAQYALDLPPGAAPVRVMQFAELDSDKWRQYAAAGHGISRWVHRREAQKLLAFEERVARAFDLSCVVSEVEKKLFERSISGITPVVLPNGVDVDHFTAVEGVPREEHTAVFTGVMDYPPNVDGVLWFVKECWPAVRSRCGAARLLLVGSRPAPAVRALDGRDGVQVTGRVPEVPPWLARAAVAVAPLRMARGVQNKVLEAMSAGLPVVASPQAAQGLGAGPESGLLVARGAQATVAALLDWFLAPDRARHDGAAAAAWVRTHFRWEHMFARLDRELVRLLPDRWGAVEPPTGPATGTPPQPRCEP